MITIYGETFDGLDILIIALGAFLIVKAVAVFLKPRQR